jgi:hypothetical protein
MLSQIMTLNREVSRIAKANNRADSIRATIPKKIADELNLDAGDFLEWRVETEKGGDKYMKVKKMK